jgi:hypothetical protein
VILALAAAPASAGAAVRIDGSPLDVFTGASGDQSGPGGLQARFDGQAGGELFDPSADATAAGFHLAVFDLPAPGQSTLFGPRDPTALPAVAFTELTAPSPSGTGTAGDPFLLESSYRAGGPNLDVAQRLSYINGQTAFLASYVVTNNGTAPARFRPTMAGDIFFAGDDRGYGVFETGPPRLVSGVNDVVGGGVALQDVAATPFTHYEENDISTIWARLFDTASAGFADTVNPSLTDAGLGVQWDDTTLAVGASATFEIVWILGGFDGLTLEPLGKQAPPGTQTDLTATVRNHAQPIAGKAVRYAITGANPSSGSVTTGAGGTAQIAWTGDQPGLDTVTAYVDSNGNGVRDVREVERTSTVLWKLPPPVYGRTANLKNVGGDVEVRLPGSSRTVQIPSERQVPIGTTIDVTDGRVNLTVGRGPRGGIQGATVFAGKFRLFQKRKTRKRRPTTDLILKGRVGPCKKGRKAGAAARRKRRLWGNARGRFRSRGRNSAATVRGTVWLVEDRCDGTLTYVRRGKVAVRDLVKKKTIVIKKGQRYLARNR